MRSDPHLMTVLLRRALAGIRVLFHRSRVDQDLDDELQAYLETAIERRMDAGLSRAAAIRAARIELGSTAAVKQHVREVGWESSVHDLWQDARYAVQGLRRSPGFSLVTILTLALGIGAGAAVFSVVDIVLLRPLPYPDPDRLVSVSARDDRGGRQPVAVTQSEFRALREVKSFAGLAAYSVARRELADANGRATRVDLARVTDGFLSLIDARFAAGRGFSSDEYRRHARVIVLTHELWTSRYGGDRTVIGRGVFIRQEPHEIIGVLARDQGYPRNADLVRPIRDDEVDEEDRELIVVARLREGSGTSAAAEEATGTLHRSVVARPVDRGRFSATVQPLQAALVKDAQDVLWLLLVLVSIIIAMVCVNAASLMLARAATRQREMAVRSAFGAGRSRLISLCLAESVIVAGFGGLLGVAVGHVVLRAVMGMVQREIPTLAELELDARVIMIVILVSVACGLFSGLAPAWIESRQPRSGLTGSSSTGRGGHLLRRALVTAQIALSTVLVVAAVQVAAAFRQLVAFDRGFRNTDFLELQVNPISAESPEGIIALYDRLRQAIGEISGVQAVELANFSPVDTRGLRALIQIAQTDSIRKPVEVSVGIVSPRYFERIGVPLVGGRYFSADTDYRGADSVAIVNQALVDALVYPADPLGLTVTALGLPRRGEAGRIVGVVADVKPTVDAPATPTIYLPFTQQPWPAMFVLIAAPDGGDAASTLVAERIWAADPRVLIDHVGRLDAKVTRTTATPRFTVSVVGGVAALALALAGVGLYGLLSHVVASRRREFAIRRAVGATSGGFLVIVARHALLPTVSGLLLGIAAAVGSTQWLSSAVYGVGGPNAANMIAPPITLGLVALIACVPPALRAIRTDPSELLRGE